MKIFLMLALISATFTTTSAFADTFASTSLSNYRYTLEDLDLNDGITPSILFNLDSTFGGYSIGYAKDGVTTNNTGSNAMPILDTVDDGNGRFAIAGIVGYSVDNRALLISGGSLGDPLGNGFSVNYSAYQNSYAGSVLDIYSFVLSGNTRVSFTADSVNYAQITSDAIDVDEFALSSSRLSISPSILDTTGSISDFGDAYVSNFTNGPDASLNILSTLSVFFNNRLEKEFSGYLSSSVYMSGGSFIPATVPVPAALPLMASALGAFGIARRRNKSKAA